MITIVPTLPVHVEELAVTMRMPDVHEVKAVGSTPLVALTGGLQRSSECYTALDEEGSVVAIFGISRVRCPVSAAFYGVPWLLASDLIENHWFTFVKLSSTYIQGFLREHGNLTNLTAKANTKVIAWLKRCGFSFSGGEYLLGPNNTPFIQFYMRKTDV